MISIAEAQRIVAAQAVEQQTFTLPLVEAAGHYLAEAVAAPFDLPAFDNSAMDGYAVCGEHTTYRLVGEVAAGSAASYHLQSGEAVRIFTGGKVPANATAVIMQEKTSVRGQQLTLTDSVVPGKNIRPRAGELATGQTVFEAGQAVTPATIGLIGSLGMAELNVYRKPDIRLITTGNELVPPGTGRNEGQIYESNSYALSAALHRHGFRCQQTRQIADDFAATKSGIAEMLEASDVLLLSGGISVGDYDFVKQALIENGVQELFYKVFQKPGKPLWFGRKGGKFVFALPGNPASSLTCLYVYVIPLLQRMAGATETGLPRVRVPLAHDYTTRSDRPAFLKARVSGHKVSILDGQGSSIIHSMALGNALAFMEPEASLQAGDLVECLLIF